MLSANEGDILKKRKDDITAVNLGRMSNNKKQMTSYVSNCAKITCVNDIVHQRPFINPATDRDQLKSIAWSVQ